MKIKQIILLLLLAVSFYSCHYLEPKEQPEPIARVGEVYLPKTVILNLGTEELSEEDSTNVVNNFIDNWIEKQVLLQNASENLSLEETSEVEKKVLDYKESLLSHLYETRLVQERVDTLVTENEMVSYYESHQEDFAVAEPIVKFFMIKNDTEFRNSNEIVNWLSEYESNQNDAKLTEYCSLQAITCYTDIEQWVAASQFYETLEANGSTTGIALRKGGLMKRKSENYFYLYKLFAVQENGVYPFEYVQQRIQEMIIRKRKQDFLEELHKNILESAKNNNEIEVYEN